MSMNGEQPMPPDWTTNELERIAKRQGWSIQILSERVGMLVRENVELMSIVQELQTDLAELKDDMARAVPPQPSSSVPQPVPPRDQREV